MSTLERLVLLALVISPGLAMAAPAAGHYFERRSCLQQLARDVELASFKLAPDPVLTRCDVVSK